MIFNKTIQTNKKLTIMESFFYAILIVQNPYSSGDRGKEYGWYRNEWEMTRAEFTKSAKRVAQRLAERKFYDTLKNGEKVKVFTDAEKFKNEYQKLTGMTPAL
jgi:hypothetical protein